MSHVQRARVGVASGRGRKDDDGEGGGGGEWRREGKVREEGGGGNVEARWALGEGRRERKREEGGL